MEAYRGHGNLLAYVSSLKLDDGLLATAFL